MFGPYKTLLPPVQVPMNLFLMFMAGNSISIFPIMMVGMMLLRPIKALWATNQTFKTIEGTHAIMQVRAAHKATYIHL